MIVGPRVGDELLHHGGQPPRGLPDMLHLVAGNGDGGLEVVFEDQPLELGGTGDVGALTDIDELGDGLGHAGIVTASRPESRMARGMAGTCRGAIPASASAMA